MTRKRTADSPSRLVEIAEDGTETEAPEGAASEYFDWLSSSIAKYEDLAKSLISHHGEKGRIVEGVVRGVLRAVLPERYSIGSGFVITSDGQSSSQIDLVIFDALYNSPITMGEGVGLFPIECVYATVEVKSVLTSAEVAKIARSIGNIRRFATTKRYVGYREGRTEKGAPIVEAYTLEDTLSPRAYTVAVRSELSVGTLEEALIEATTEHDAHIHGLAVIDRDWFFKQHAHRTPHEFHVASRKSLAALCSAVLTGIQSMAMMPAAMDRYLGQIDEDDDWPRDSNGTLEEAD